MSAPTIRALVPATGVWALFSSVDPEDKTVDPEAAAKVWVKPVVAWGLVEAGPRLATVPPEVLGCITVEDRVSPIGHGTPGHFVRYMENQVPPDVAKRYGLAAE